MDSSVDISPSELTPGARADLGGGESAAAAEAAKNASSKEHSLVQDLVSQNRVVVFSKSHCPHCNNSKSLLSGMGVNFKAVELDKMQEGSLVQNVLGSITNARTVPRIFIDGQCVGGNSELQSLDQNGQLENLLKGANDPDQNDTCTGIPYDA